MKRNSGWLAVGRCLALAAGLLGPLHGYGNSGAPAITTQPVSQDADIGSTVTFALEATGQAPLRYQWRFNGTNLPAATNASLVLTNVQPRHWGSYAAVVTNSLGTNLSAAANLVVDRERVFQVLGLQTNAALAFEHNQLTGDDRGGIAVSTSSVFVTGDEQSATFSLDTLQGGTSLGRRYDTLVSNLRTETVYSLGNGATIIEYDGSFTPNTINSLIEINGSTGQPTGQRINLSTNIPISTGSGVYAGYDRVVLYINSNQRCYNIDLPSGRVTEVASGSISQRGSESWATWGIAEYYAGAIHLLGIQFITVNSVSGGAIVRTRLPERTSSVVVPPLPSPGLSDMASFTFSVSRSRWFFHHEGTSIFRSGDESVGSAKASFNTDASYPAILVEPSDLVAFPENNVTLRATASGAPPLSYQWFFRGTNAIAGATEPELTLNNISTNDMGLYRIVVSNPLGSVTSREALLTIYSVPQITTQPRSISIFPGTNALFSVFANAAPPLRYQWRFNGAAIAGQTNSTLLLTNVQPAQAGLYSVVLSNRFGTAISANAELNVVVPVDDGSVFQVTSLQTNGARITDVYQSLDFNYTYGPFAVSSARVFYSSFNVTGHSSASDLSGGTLANEFYVAMASNLRNETAYALGGANGPFTSTQGGNLNTLHEINGVTGGLTGNRIPLSPAISLPFLGSQVGIFSGYERIVLLANLRAYNIALPSGVVTDLGPMNVPAHAFPAFGSGTFYGIAEHAGGITYLVYTRDSRNIARTRVPDGVTTNFVTFSNLGSYMSSISASVPRGRWYFNYVFGNTTFGGGNALVGYATATFTNNLGFKADRFEFDPINPVQTVSSPFPVTITARTSSNQIDTNYNGVPTLSGISVPQGTPVPINTVFPGGFVKGVLTGTVTVPQPSPGMALRISDINLVGGTSSVFTVSPPNDLALTVTDTPDPVVVGQSLNYALLITNTGPATATSVSLTNILPAGVQFISVANSQGSCNPAGGTVLCNLGNVIQGAVVRVDIVVGVSLPGTLTNQTFLGRGESDPLPSNNSAVTLTTVTLPSLSINDITVPEGNSGTNDAVFTVSLSAAATNTISVTFQTVNGSATSSGTIPDYVARSGIVTFPPGTLTQTVTVGVRGDVFNEFDEFFSVILLNPVGGALADNQGTCTIPNDDPVPTVSVSDISVTEGNAGTTNAIFQIRLSTNSGLAVFVAFATANGTAQAGTDYIATNNFVFFAAGNPNLTRNVIVPVRGDTNVEPNETFSLSIIVTNATGLKTQAVCTIVADDGLGTLSHFGFSPISSPQQSGTPFPVTLTAQDVFGNPFTSFNGTVNLSAQAGAPPTSIFQDTAFTNTFDGDFTLGYSFIPKTDIVVSHFRHYTGTKVSIWTEQGALLASQPVTSVPGTWVETPLTTPVSLQAGVTYYLAYYTGGGAYYFGNVEQLDRPEVTLIAGQYQSGDAFPDLDPGTVGWSVDIRYSVGALLTPVAITPATAGPFVNGVWTGQITALTNSTNIILRASDAAQHLGFSAPFDVQETVDADVRVQFAPTVRSIPVGSNLTYTIVASNSGPGTATEVIVNSTPPPGMFLLSAQSTQGSASIAGNVLQATLGNLTRNTAATIIAIARPNITGTFTNVATVTALTADPVLANNESLDNGTVVYRDTDGDGLWDNWEIDNNLDIDDPADALLDLDGDRHSNWEEFMAGTDPRNAASATRLLEVSGDTSGVQINFRGVRGKTYRLDRREFPTGGWVQVLTFTISSDLGSSETVELVDPLPPTVGVRFYRVQILPE